MNETKIADINTGIDRYFFAIMAVLFAASAVVGFAPNSISILVGVKENPPLIIHLHAAAMSAWLILRVAQASLVATQRFDIHQRLGITSVGLAPIVFFLMIAIAWPYLADPAKAPAIFVIQIKRIALFGVCVALAITWRKRWPGAHKRLMFMATFAVLDAAFFRMTFLPNLGMENDAIIGHLYQYALLLPLLAYDIAKFGRIHPVYLVVVPIFIGLQTFSASLW